jgi:hypothetical protein
VVSIEQVTMLSGLSGFHANEVMGGRLVCGLLLCYMSLECRLKARYCDHKLTLVRTLRVFKTYCSVS